MTRPEVPAAHELEWPSEIRCHEGESVHADELGARWNGDCCSYCGSGHPAVVYEFLRTTPYVEHPIFEPSPAGVDNLDALRVWREEQDRRIRAWRGVEVADWKYGWPHKFYLTTGDSSIRKWYNIHLEDLGGTEAFRPFTDLIFEHTGIRFLWYPDRVKMAGRKRKGQLGYIGGR